MPFWYFCSKKKSKKEGQHFRPYLNLAYPGSKKGSEHVRQIFIDVSPSSSFDSENLMLEEEPKGQNNLFEGDTYELTSIPLERFNRKHFYPDISK